MGRTGSYLSSASLLFAEESISQEAMGPECHERNAIASRCLGHVATPQAILRWGGYSRWCWSARMRPSMQANKPTMADKAVPEGQTRVFLWCGTTKSVEPNATILALGEPIRNRSCIEGPENPKSETLPVAILAQDSYTINKRWVGLSLQRSSALMVVPFCTPSTQYGTDAELRSLPTPMPPQSQQQCVLAMLVPAGQFPYAATQPSMMCQTEKFGPHVALQPPVPPEILHPNMQLTPVLKPVHAPGVGSSTCSEDEHGAAQRELPSPPDTASEADRAEGLAKLSTSAARRLRRKRASQRALASPAPKPWASNGPVAVGRVWNPLTEIFDSAAYEDLQQQLQGSPEQVSSALTLLKDHCVDHVWDLSCHPLGCRLIQLALERATPREAAELARELRGHIREALMSPHANYVVQKVVTQLTWNSCSFVADELEGFASKFARHRFGCRIFCRLLEFYASQDGTLRLVDEVLQEAEDLCCHPFGHHVAQSVLEHGTDCHRDAVAKTICSNPMGFAQNQNASYLVEKVLSFCSPHYQRSLLAELTESLEELALSRYGCYVVRVLVEHPDTDRSAAVSRLWSCIGELRRTKHGQHLMTDLGMSMNRGRR